MKILGFDFAPLYVQFERLLQNAAVFYYSINLTIWGFIMLFLSVCTLFTEYYYLFLLYSIWFIYDRKTCCQGGRRSEWYRSCHLWKYFAAYFPITMVKTAELPPNKNYIIGCHPHGIMSHGAFCCFGTEGTNFGKEFPGITTRVLTLELFFLFPLHREHIMLPGACSASRESIEWNLTKYGTGNALVLVIGGVTELLSSHPGTVTLILKNRKGFVKYALKHGASLVPVFAFGENDLYDQVESPEGSKLRTLQNILKKLTTITLPLFRGRDYFFLLPRKKPVYVVIGKPIDVDKVEEPTEEDIKKLHDLYIKSLVALFEEHKQKYSKDSKLVIT